MDATIPTQSRDVCFVCTGCGAEYHEQLTPREKPKVTHCLACKSQNALIPFATASVDTWVKCLMLKLKLSSKADADALVYALNTAYSRGAIDSCDTLTLYFNSGLGKILGEPPG